MDLAGPRESDRTGLRYGVTFTSHKPGKANLWQMRNGLARRAQSAYNRPMQFRLLDDRIFYPLAAIVAAVLIAFSVIWPQGQGKPSPVPFGHAQELPDYFRMVKERDQRKAKEAADKAARQAASAASSAAASAASGEFASGTASTAP